ncbi:MAG: hypothetical protein JSR46_12510 [Verrucomicrobia bacterium]|nr:hypothetical protein [Verrucomicrobiota bacterium]
MSITKMTDMLATTGAFFATFTHSFKNKATDSWETPTIEVSPVISAHDRDGALASSFFKIITSDSSNDHRHHKDELLWHFVESCSRKESEEFWENAAWTTLEASIPTTPWTTCVLYNQRGEAVDVRICKTADIVSALRRVESSLFEYITKKPLAAVNSRRKELKKDLNRETHKYFLHHKHPR